MQCPETRTLHAVPEKMHFEKSIGIILKMYNQLQLNAAAISSSGGKWVKASLVQQTISQHCWNIYLNLNFLTARLLVQ